MLPPNDAVPAGVVNRYDVDHGDNGDERNWKLPNVGPSQVQDEVRNE